MNSSMILLLSSEIGTLEAIISLLTYISGAGEAITPTQTAKAELKVILNMLSLLQKDNDG